MSWIIERDNNDKPIRMVWCPGADEYAAERNRELKAARYKALLPMPAMREWAHKYGLVFKSPNG